MSSNRSLLSHIRLVCRRVRMQRAASDIAVLLALAACNVANAQIVQLGTIAPSGRAAIRTAFSAGVPPAPAKSSGKAGSRFRPAVGRVAIARVAAGYAVAEADRRNLVTSFESVIAKYEASAAASGWGNDMAGGLVVLLMTRELLATGKELPDVVQDKIALQLQAVLDTPEIAGLADREKQAVNEWAICTATMFLAMQAQATKNGGDPEHKFAAAAGDILADVFGVAANRITINDQGLAIADASIAPGVGQGDIARKPTAEPHANAAAGAASAPLPAPDVPIAGQRQTWQDWSYVVPRGWQAEVMSDGVMIRAPKTNPASLGYTFIFLMPLRAAKPDPYAQGLEILGEIFAQNFSSFRDYDFDDPNPYLHKVRGLNGDGWPYIMLRTKPVDRQNRPTGHQARILLFQLGTQVAPVIGFQNSDDRTMLECLTGKCLDWTLLYHSLAFPKLRAPGNAGIRDQLIGTWFSSSGRGREATQNQFKADGTYANVSAYKTYQDLPGTMVLEKTTSWFGEGRFVVHGDQLSVWPVRGKPQTNLFHIVEEANSVSPGGWLRMLYRVELTYDGKEAYESRMVISK